MKFSIIIAAYNVEEFISQAINSCLQQETISSNDFEIIAIDDGSTDRTGQIMDSFSASDNLIIIHQHNQGLSVTRNTGVSMAKGDFILFLDGDDWLSKDALISLYPFIDKYDLIAFPLAYFYHEDNIQIKGYGLKKQCYSSEDFLKNTIGRSQLHIIPAQTKCYKKDVLKQQGQVFVEKILHEDNPYFVDTIFNFHNIYYLNKAIYYYRQNRVGSITASCTLRNFNGTIVGIRYIINKWGIKNKDISYLISCWLVFSVIQQYKDAQEFEVVKCYFRRMDIKYLLVKIFFHSRFIAKEQIRLFLLILDPLILKKFINLYSTRFN